MSYTFITEFVFLINCISFPCKGDDSSFINVKFHSVSSAPTVKGISVRLSKCTISYKAYGVKNFISSSK